MNDHYITHQRVSAARGIYAEGDYMATYVPCGPRGKRGGAVAPSTLLRVRKTVYYGMTGYGSIAWMAEVVIPGSTPTVIEPRYGSTRDAAVRNAVKAYREGVAA